MWRISASSRRNGHIPRVESTPNDPPTHEAPGFSLRLSVSTFWKVTAHRLKRYGVGEERRQQEHMVLPRLGTVVVLIPGTCPPRDLQEWTMTAERNGLTDQGQVDCTSSSGYSINIAVIGPVYVWIREGEARIRVKSRRQDDTLHDESSSVPPRSLPPHQFANELLTS